MEEGYQGSLETYLNKKLEAKLKAVSNKEDADLAREFFLHYGLLAKKKKEEPIPTFTPLTPEEIGLLSPRVKYLASKEAGEVTTATAIIEGKIVRYKPVSPEGLSIGEIRVKPAKGKTKETLWQLLGTTEDGNLVIKRTDAAAIVELVEKEGFLKWELKEEDQEEVVSFERAAELLGPENVHGKKDVEYLFGFTLEDKDIPPIPYSEADLQKSKEIKEKTGVEEMLVLFVKDKDGTPLTGEKLNALVQKKYDELGLGKFLVSIDWYKNKDFYKTLDLQYGWRIITKGCIPNSKNRSHHYKDGDNWKHEDTQEYAIERYAEKVGIPRGKLHRPEPFQMLAAVALHLTATKRDKGEDKMERLLVDEYHWSDTSFSDGDLVYVGDADSDGANVDRYSRDGRFVDIGVCFSRDSS